MSKSNISVNSMSDTILHIRSRSKPVRWEEAMLCGNGVSGLMVMGGTRVEELEWDLDQGVIRGSLTSKAPQTIEVFGPACFASAPAAAGQSWGLLGMLTLDSAGEASFEYRT